MKGGEGKMRESQKWKRQVEGRKKYQGRDCQGNIKVNIVLGVRLGAAPPM
jgi:hypothetical protein